MTLNQPGRLRKGHEVAARLAKRRLTQTSSNTRPDFLKTFRGTLSTTISEEDLQTLNAGLTILFDRLREAKRVFQKSADGGREGAFTALGGLWQFAALFSENDAEALHLPVVRLMDALACLDNNKVLPIVKPQKRRGNPPLSHAEQSIRGNAAGTVRRLQKLGIEMSAACKMVAQTLAKLDIRSARGTGKISRTTIAHWCETVDSDVSRSGTAAQIFDSMFTAEDEQKYHSLSLTDGRFFALSSMQRYAEELN